MLKCRLCGQIFKDKAGFMVHLNLRAENSCLGLKGVTRCPVCNSQFEKEDHLRKHMKGLIDDVAHQMFLFEETQQKKREV